MPPPDPKVDFFPPTATPLERTAARWLALIDRGMTPEEESEFERWLAADPRHAEIFSEVDGTWCLLDRVADLRAAVITPARPSGESAVDSGAGERQPTARTKSAAVQRVRRWHFPAMLAAAAAAVVSWLWWSYAASQSKDYSTVAATEIGGLRQIDLPDGSIVLLNTDSAVEIGFTDRERRVRLTRGEGHFSVAHNPSRPFIVHAGGVDVRAVGTAFGVRLRAAAVDVLVTEGTVRVNDAVDGTSLLATEPDVGSSLPAIPPMLAAGQKVSIPLAPQAALTPKPALPVTLPKIELDHSLSWRSQRLEFVSEPLGTMVAEINRYNRHQLVIEDERLAQEHFGGTFRPNDWAGFVRVLASNFNVIVEEREDRTILRSAK